MIFGRRKKFNGQVAALLPAFSLTLDECGEMKTLDVLDIAWQQNYNQYEGAIYVAYLTLAGYLKADEAVKFERLVKQIENVSASWVKEGLVKPELAQRFSEKAAGWRQ